MSSQLRHQAIGSISFLVQYSRIVWVRKIPIAPYFIALKLLTSFNRRTFFEHCVNAIIRLIIHQ
jgi:hypothetical protein